MGTRSPPSRSRCHCLRLAPSIPPWYWAIPVKAPCPVSRTSMARTSGRAVREERTLCVSVCVYNVDHLVECALCLSVCVWSTDLPVECALRGPRRFSRERRGRFAYQKVLQNTQDALFSLSIQANSLIFWKTGRGPRWTLPNAIRGRGALAARSGSAGLRRSLNC